MSTSERGMRWEAPSKDWSTRNRKKKIECFAKFIRESKGAWKMYNFNFLCKLWIWFTTKINKVKLTFLSTIKRCYCLLSPIPSAVLSTILPLAYLAYVGICGWFRVVTISPFRLLNRVSVWALKVDEEQSIVTFLYHHLFPQVSSIKL